MTGLLVTLELDKSLTIISANNALISICYLLVYIIYIIMIYNSIYIHYILDCVCVYFTYVDVQHVNFTEHIHSSHYSSSRGGCRLQL